jgi:predicted DNA-binding antitoxin AbrB/MazE fold protein
MDLEAIYEDGILKLPCDLPLQRGQKVRITVHPPGSAAQRLSGLIRWTGSEEDLDYLLGPDNHPWAREE